ncbi:metallophosphoesterase [Cellulomonas sp. NPDC089187]|uniref:metallophosphoesterase family protein n=1 Tax=Cellulomonas sp. NPDC089187 TaxID=3154970 RepID=UPI003426D184
MSENSAPTAAPGRLRNRLGWALGVLLAVVVALTFGVTTASARLSFGPHEAQYDVTIDQQITLDLGPLGALELDSPLPLGLGARVTVQEIPEDVDALNDIDTLQQLSDDAASYLQFFTGPQATVEDAARALIGDALWRAGLALLVIAAGTVAVRALLGRARRTELARGARQHYGPVLSVTATVLVLVLAVSVSVVRERREQAQATPVTTVFDDTPLEGARVTGRLGGIINTYGGLLVDAYRDNEDFYAQADDALVAAWQDWETTPAADDSPAPEPTASTSPTPSASPSGEGSEPITLLLVSDLHCNVGMAPLITSMVELSGAQIVLDAGDTTMNGTSVEQYCVTTFARAIPSGVDLVTAPGNHDSSDTTAQYAKAGATVLDGSVIDVRGIRILGDHDPKATRLIIEQQQDESYSSVARRLNEVACADPDGVDLVLFHNPRIPALLDDGCVPALFSGHLHSRTDPEQIGQGIRYISSSTAGAQENEPRIGPLKGTAEMTLLRFDPDTRSILDWQLIEIGTDASATVHDRTAWPQIEELPAEDEDEDGSPTPTASPTAG